MQNLSSFKNKLSSIKFRDNIKTNFCKKSNINLLRISFEKFNEIENILDMYVYK